jgi:O-antigen ligase
LIISKIIVIKLNAIDILLISFYAYSIIRLLVKNPENYLNESIIQLLIFIILYFNYKSFLNFKFQSDKFFLLIFSIIILLNGLIQVIWGGLQLLKYLPVYDNLFKVTGSFQNPAPYGYYLALILIFSFGLICYLPNKKSILKFIWFLSLIVSIGAIIILPFTRERIAWLMSLFGVLIITYYKFQIKNLLQRTLKNSLVKISSILLLVMLIFTIGVWLYKFKPQSVDGRILVWKVSKQMVLENPLFGIGYGQFDCFYDKYEAQWFYQNKGNFNDQNHADNIEYTYNEFYQILIEDGIIGFILFSLFIILILKSLLKFSDFKKRQVILFTLFLSVLFCAVVSYPFRNITINILCILIMATISENFDENKIINFEISNISTKRITIFLCIIFLIFFTNKEYEKIKANVRWYYLQNTSLNKFNVINHNEIFKEIYPVLKFNGNFLCDYGVFLLNNKEFYKSIYLFNEAKKYYFDDYLYLNMGDAYNEINDFKDAEIAYKQAKYMLPNRLWPKYSLMLLYDKSGQKDKAKFTASEILNIHLKINTRDCFIMKKEAKKLLEKYE